MILFRESLPNLSANIRFLHAIPDGPSIDVYANGKLIYSNLSFGNVTNYIGISPNKYDIQLYKAGTYDNPIITESIDVLPGETETVNITYENKEISFFTIDDSEPINNPLLAYIRFINLSPTAPLLSLSLPEGIVLFDQAEYLETNDYYPISPGIYNFVVSATDSNFEKYISNVNLKAKVFLTIYIIGLFNGKPEIGYILLKDGKSSS